MLILYVLNKYILYFGLDRILVVILNVYRCDTLVTVTMQTAFNFFCEETINDGWMQSQKKSQSLYRLNRD